MSVAKGRYTKRVHVAVGDETLAGLSELLGRLGDVPAVARATGLSRHVVLVACAGERMLPAIARDVEVRVRETLAALAEQEHAAQ